MRLAGLKLKDSMVICSFCRENTSEDMDFVFEEFVRSRVVGMDEACDTET